MEQRAEQRRRESEETDAIRKLAMAAVVDDEYARTVEARINSYVPNSSNNPFTKTDDWRQGNRGDYRQRWQCELRKAKELLKLREELITLVTELEAVDRGLTEELEVATKHQERADEILKKGKKNLETLYEVIGSLNGEIEKADAALEKFEASTATLTEKVEEVESGRNKLAEELQKHRVQRLLLSVF